MLLSCIVFIPEIANVFCCCTCRQGFHYLEQFSSSTPNITTAVSLTKLLAVLSERQQGGNNSMSTALGKIIYNRPFVVDQSAKNPRYCKHLKIYEIRGGSSNF